MRKLSILFLLNLLQGCYVTRLAIEQNTLFNSRIPVHTVIHDPKADPFLVTRLRLLQEILRFAEIEGLNTRGAYLYFVPLQRKEISYLVQASYPDRLELKSWWFPIVGDVTYLGFFDQQSRDNEAKILAEENYDVHTSTVSAYSSLGWFDDPIYESMLNGENRDLAELIFHELTHRTLWIPGNVPINEQMASFVGEKLMLKFLKSKNEIAQIEDADVEKQDRKNFAIWLEKLTSELTDLYASNLSRDKILKKKSEIFKESTTKKKAVFSRYDFVGQKPWNNARVLGASAYSPDNSSFEKAYQCSAAKNAGEFLQFLATQLKQGLSLKEVCPPAMGS